MASFRYRAATASGALRTGSLEAESVPAALDLLRRQGLRPISAAPAPRIRAGGGGASPTTIARGLGELAVMIEAGVPMDRALAVVVDNVESAPARTAFARLLAQVREGAPLSRAMAEATGDFPPMASAMTAAGEANGRPAEALAKLAEALERAAALRAAVVSATIYPALLLVIAIGVIALMMLWVVPQFEGLFSDAGAQLPPMTRFVLAASEDTRRYGLYGVAALILAGVALWRWMRTETGHASVDRLILSVPALGVVVRHAETARFARVLSSLVQGGVALPEALAIANGSLANRVMSEAIADVVERLRQGGGLTAPLAAAGVLPAMAISYLRTGEETARLGLMLARLADTLDRDVRVRLDRLIAVATPVVTVAMGAIVATVIASIMTAIIGFDDLALGK